jgi:ABC-type branched-subunit amino acid transport system substrate-binding protein
LVIGLILGACQIPTLTKVLPKNQDSLPVHSSPSTDPEGPAFKAQARAERNAVMPDPVSEPPSVQSAPSQSAITVELPQVASLPPARFLADGPTRAKKVALLLPLSGPRAQLGRELLNASQIAVFDLADENFVIYPFDTKGSAAGAAAAATQAITAGAELILGPLLASSVRAVRPITNQAKISVVAFSNSRDVAGDGIYILGFVPRQQVGAVVEHAVSEGLYRYAVLAPNNAYGRAVVAALKEVVSFHEALVVKVQYYDPAATDFSQPTKVIAGYERRHKALMEQRAELEARKDEVSKQVLKRMEKLDTLGEVDYDAVLLPGSGQQLKAIASLLSYYDVDQPAVRLLGLSNWAQTANIETEPSLSRAWYAAPPREERENFFQRYRKLYGRPPAAIASLAYDATALAIVLAQSNGMNVFARSRLVQPFGFLGVDGLFRLREEGVTERVFEVREVTRKGFKVRMPAATAFPQVGR